MTDKDNPSPTTINQALLVDLFLMAGGQEERRGGCYLAARSWNRSIGRSARRCWSSPAQRAATAFLGGGGGARWDRIESSRAEQSRQPRVEEHKSTGRKKKIDDEAASHKGNEMKMADRPTHRLAKARPATQQPLLLPPHWLSPLVGPPTTISSPFFFLLH